MDISDGNDILSSEINTDGSFESGDFDIIKDALSGLKQYLANGSPLKMMKMLLISPLKLFSFSRYFCLDLSVV